MLKSFKLLAPHESTAHNALQDCNDLRRLTVKMGEDYAKKHPKNRWQDFLQMFFRSNVSVLKDLEHSRVNS